MPEIKNNFLKGRMNQDLDSRILPMGEYREAINLLISRSEGSTVGEFENILGNTSVGTVSSAKALSVIGNFIDQTNNKVYAFATDFSNDDPNSRATSSQTCVILEFDLANPGTPNTLVSGFFLNFNKKFPIYGVNLLEDLLFWTDNFNQPRRINITTARNSASAYTKEVQISVAKYYPYDAIIPMERQTATTAANGTTTQINIASGNANIRVGDIVTDNDKTDIPNATISNTSPVVKVIEILNPGTNTQFKVAPAITPNALAAGIKIDFSRTSMENRSEQYKSNYSIQTVDAINQQGSDVEMTDPVLGGIPRVGDIVEDLTTPDAIPNINHANAAYRYPLRIATLRIDNVSTSSTGRWRFTFDKSMTAGGNLAGISVSDSIAIATNPLYESGFGGDTKFLDDKFVRFSYRYKFNDNEYSLMAPFSQTMFIPRQYGQFGLGQIDNKYLPPGNYSTDPGINNYYQDETDAYTSTILEWFENDIDSIGLKIPLPNSITNTQSIYNIKEIDILYRESDALAVKVLDTIDVNAITGSQTSTINYDDDIHGLLNQLYYNYTYKSNKPYKTLPENQTTRVYDKVPIKALGQEIITNRITYGNYVERMTPPSVIPYTVGYSNRDAQNTDYYTQYPFNTVKQNRIYQVGFVLVDYFGRQSDVILSSYDNQNIGATTDAGSSIYIPYHTSGSTSVLNWLGTNLTLQIDEAIATTNNSTSGEPGIYREEGFVAGITIDDAGSLFEANKTYAADGGGGCTIRVTSVDGSGRITAATIMTGGGGYTNGGTLILLSPGGGDDAELEITTGIANPLGWYSYKVVVKQQEQEYYNVYLPGFINGLPVQDFLWDGVSINTSGSPIYPDATPLDTQRGKIGFATVLGDNINKIPRNLKEVGPTDEEYNSDEILYVRVNNPNVAYVSGSGTTELRNVINKQYYPGTVSQNVLNIATVKETELAAVPFKPFNIAPITVNSNLVPEGGATTGNQGEYGATTTYVPSGTTSESRIPAGRIPWGDVADKQSFYAADQNPFIMKFSTAGNWGNPIGAIVAGAPFYGTPPGSGKAHDSNYADGVRAMQPILSIVETKPVESILELFWETTLTGRLEELNAGIESNYDGIIAMTAGTGSFAESVASTSAVGPVFKFINGSGAEVTNVQSIPTITKVVKQNDPNVPLTIADYFTVAQVTAGSEYQIKTAKNFWYSTDSNANPSSDIYIFDLEVTSGNTGQFTDTLTNALTLTLTNVAPAIYSDSNYSTNRTGASWTASNVAVGESTILQLYGLNGSVDTTGTPANRTRELVWAIGAVIPASAASNFEISETGLITTNTTLTNEQTYNITANLTDVNNTGSNKQTVSTSFNFTAGTANAPKIIGTGLTGTTGEKNMTGVGNKGEYLFANNSLYQTSSATATGNPFNLIPTFVYNAQRRYNDDIHNTPACTPVDGGSNCCRANLFQGTIELKPKLFTGNSTFNGDAYLSFSIQYRASSSNNWVNIDSVNAGAGYTVWSASDTQKFITMSTAVANQEIYYKYKFDQLGEYRVVTNAINGDGAAYVSFTVEFKDGVYNTNAGPCNPPA